MMKVRPGTAENAFGSLWLDKVKFLQINFKALSQEVICIFEYGFNRICNRKVANSLQESGYDEVGASCVILIYIDHVFFQISPILES